MARTGQLDRAAGILEERCKVTPEYAETIETHAEILDMVGESERARVRSTKPPAGCGQKCGRACPTGRSPCAAAARS